MSLQVELVSPERILYSGEAEMVAARTTEGEIAFLPEHAPFLGALGIAKLRILQDGGPDVVAAVHAGFVEVRNNKVTVLSDVAELSDQIDTARAREAQQRAEERLRAEQDARASAALARAVLRIEVAEGS